MKMISLFCFIFKTEESDNSDQYLRSFTVTLIINDLMDITYFWKV